jgi:hypothetical protein
MHWIISYHRWWTSFNYPYGDKDLRPNWNGLYAYGCRTYAINPKFKANPKFLYYKTAPRAYIGYLVGYRASNICRVWIPALYRMITIRDVTFDENTYFHPNNKGLRTFIETYQHIAEEL